MGVISQFRGLPRQVYLLSFVRTIMAMGSFVFAFISLMASSTLGMNEFQIGNVMLFVALASVGGSLTGGKLADTFGRKKMFLLADILAVVTIVLAGFYCDTFYALIFMIFSYAFSSMATPIIAAMIADYSEEKNRTECFSVLYLSQNIGFAIGPSIGGLLFHNYMEWAFFGQGILFALSGLWMMGFVRDDYVAVRSGRKESFAAGAEPAAEIEKKAGTALDAGAAHRADGTEAEKRIEGRTDRTTGRATDRATWFGSGLRSGLKPSKSSVRGESLLSSLWRRPVVLAFVLCLIVLTACYQEISFMLPLQFTELFGIGAGSRYSGFIWSVNALVCVSFTPLIIAVTKKNSQLLNITVASVFYAVGFALNGMVSHIVLFYLAAAVWTSGEIMISTGSGVFIANHAPQTHKARYQSLYEVSRGFGRGIGPNLCGFYLLSHTFGQAWLATAFICLVATGFILALYFVDRRTMKQKRAESCDAAG